MKQFSPFINYASRCIAHSETHLLLRLLHQEFRQPFLDSSWSKIYDQHAKSQLQNLLCELDFRLLWYDRIIKAMKTPIWEIALKERTNLTCTSQYPLYWTCNFISGTYNEAYFSRCLQIWEAFRLEKSCVKLTEMSPFQCVYWISFPLLYLYY